LLNLKSIIFLIVVRAGDLLLYLPTEYWIIVSIGQQNYWTIVGTKIC